MTKPIKASRRLDAASPGNRRRRVLVIDDSVDVAEGLQAFLQTCGHDARVAHDGASGVALAREMHAEIVFCDLGLPGMDGYQVARALRADAEIAGAHLVALSGLARGKDREQSAAAGFDCHLAKPPSEQDIERILAARRD